MALPCANITQPLSVCVRRIPQQYAKFSSWCEHVFCIQTVNKEKTQSSNIEPWLQFMNWIQSGAQLAVRERRMCSKSSEKTSQAICECLSFPTSCKCGVIPTHHQATAFHCERSCDTQNTIRPTLWMRIIKLHNRTDPKQQYHTAEWMHRKDNTGRQSQREMNTDFCTQKNRLATHTHSRQQE